MLGISVSTSPCATPSAFSKKFFVLENSSSEPMPWAPPPPIETAHVLLVDGASPPKTLPIDPLNIAWADAEVSSAKKAVAAASNNRVIRKTCLQDRYY